MTRIVVDTGQPQELGSQTFLRPIRICWHKFYDHAASGYLCAFPKVADVDLVFYSLDQDAHYSSLVKST